MLHRHQVRLRIMGQRDDLPAEVQAALNHVESVTAHYERQLILCLSYGGRREIVSAAKKLAQAAAEGKLDPASIDEDVFATQLYLPDVPDPDLIVRTSGEMRLSNFLLWQASYAELYVTPVLWPDFDKAEFDKALSSYSRRERRMGGRFK
jgi:undecaprenyl diphosphate synthase